MELYFKCWIGGTDDPNVPFAFAVVKEINLYMFLSK
jgi:hypothetical protein